MWLRHEHDMSINVKPDAACAQITKRPCYLTTNMTFNLDNNS